MIEPVETIGIGGIAYAVGIVSVVGAMMTENFFYLRSRMKDSVSGIERIDAYSRNYSPMLVQRYDWKEAIPAILSFAFALEVVTILLTIFVVGFSVIFL